MYMEESTACRSTSSDKVPTEVLVLKVWYKQLARMYSLLSSIQNLRVVDSLNAESGPDSTQNTKGGLLANPALMQILLEVGSHLAIVSG